MKGVILVILSKCFPIFSWFSATVASYLKHRLSSLPLGEKCPYSELFWSDSPAFGLNMDRYSVSLRITPYSFRMRENTNQNNSDYGHFLHSVLLGFIVVFLSFIHLEDFLYGPPRLRFIL